MRQPRRFLALAALCLASALAGCALETPVPETPRPRPSEVRAGIAALIPATVPDRAGWATDVYAALAALELQPSPRNVCAVLAVTEQESSYRADPQVPGLAKIAWTEIERRAERVGVPMFAVRLALKLPSGDGRSYAERIDGARTERELSETFQDMIDRVPLGGRLFAGLNPVRTGGPMQVAIDFAEAHAGQRSYPYPVDSSIRSEVFTRRGGLYFGIAHLLDYPADYDRPLYRFADFNAGRWASRNAGFQNAVSIASGIPLDLDGDLVRHGSDTPGSTELAVRALRGRLKASDAEIRSALEQGTQAGFERSSLYRRVFELAERAEGRRPPRAVIPRIVLKSPKITRKLTTEWFATRVDARYGRCMERAGPQWQ
ncbi:DUF1615 domain-containing protein [Quisquiliibacterium transsilvanicum]